MEAGTDTKSISAAGLRGLREVGAEGALGAGVQDRCGGNRRTVGSLCQERLASRMPSSRQRN